MGDGRTALVSPQLDHLDCHRDEPCSGNDTEDDITCEYGYGYSEDDSDTG